MPFPIERLGINGAQEDCMKALVVYDSVFGNTEQIARAVAAALGAEALRATGVQSEHLAGVQLLIAGSPTRGFRPTPVISNWLKSIPAQSLQGVRVAAFDTRISMADPSVPGILRFMVKIFGYAAKPIADRLVKKGGELAAPPEGFIVTASEGPLKEGELERAGAWAGRLVAAG